LLINPKIGAIITASRLRKNALIEVTVALLTLLILCWILLSINTCSGAESRNDMNSKTKHEDAGSDATTPRKIEHIRGKNVKIQVHFSVVCIKRTDRA